MINKKSRRLYLCGSGGCVRGFHFCDEPPCEEKTKMRAGTSNTPAWGYCKITHKGFPTTATILPSPSCVGHTYCTHHCFERSIRSFSSSRMASSVFVFSKCWSSTMLQINGTETLHACLSCFFFCLLWSLSALERRRTAKFSLGFTADQLPPKHTNCWRIWANFIISKRSHKLQAINRNTQDAVVSTGLQ